MRAAPAQTPAFSGFEKLRIGENRMTAIPGGALLPTRWMSDEAGPRQFVVPSQKSEAERAFDQLVALKITSANFGTHLTGAWRAGLFRQLDTLLDAQEWDFSDEMPSPESFRTFLRLILHSEVANRPGLGATTDGKIVAAWTAGRDRLTIECLPDDTVRWVLVKYIDGRRVSNAGSAPVAFARKYLAPFEPEAWFG